MANGGNNPRPGFLARIATGLMHDQFWPVLGRIATILLMLILFVGAAMIVYTSAQGTGPSLESRDFTRGLITIMLLTCAVAVVMVVTLASIFSGDDNSRQNIVAAGKEILAPVLGILGTIVGFYFGSSSTADSVNRNNPPAATANPANPSPAPSAAQPATNARPAPPSTKS